jgi:4-diphosphocytidyl-2-C-methyl-D-erythritol kinase
MAERMAHTRAKLNLSLRITGRRADGYHLLQSLVAFAEVGDVLHAAPAERLTLEITGPQAATLSAGPDNLVLRAAEQLRELTGARNSAALILEKHLPVASGIGGGSGDAAAALRLLCDLWGISLATADWQHLADRLGADMPVCLLGQAAWMEGIGETLTPLADFPPCAAVLINPREALPTPQVFAAYRESGQPFSAAHAPLPHFASREALFAFLAGEENDLAESACALMPAIRARLEALAALPAVRIARVSGSGATCFGLCARLSDAEAAATQLRQAFPADWIAAAPLR